MSASAVTTRLRATVLGLPDFRRLWAAQTISTIGDQVFPIAATIAVLDQGGGATQIGFVLGARVAAIVVFALLGGVWADRLPRRTVMISANVFRAVVLSALFLRALHEPSRAHVDEPRQPITSEIREGLAEVVRRRWVFANLVAASLILLLVVAPEQVLLPVISRQEFGDDRVCVASLALMSLGGVFGALLAMRWPGRATPGRPAGCWGWSTSSPSPR